LGDATILKADSSGSSTRGTQDRKPSPNRVWYLGIDLGTTGVSACLLNRVTAQRYPIGWSGAGQANAPSMILRWPAVAFLTTEQLSRMPEAPTAVGDRALKAAIALRDRSTGPCSGLLLGNFRHYQNIAIPYHSNQTQAWEPVLQWSEQQPISLEWMQQAVTAMLKTLRDMQPDGSPTCIAESMDPTTFQTALSQLAGVVIGCPFGWSDAYQFNLREAVLAARLLTTPDQVFFIEDTIAALLAELPAEATTEPQTSRQTLSRQTHPISSGKRTSWQGGTFVISAGATMTEFLLVDLPQDVHQLNRSQLHLRNIAYSGMAIDQDIISQMLYPSVWGWRNLGEPSLDLPLPGEPDLQTRYRLQQRLQSHDLGRILLAIARQLKVGLQQQSSATFSLNNRQWTMSQQDFHSRVVIPYIQLLNRELNTLLAETGLGVQAIRRVICTGGTASFPAIGHWLQQKLPNANLVWDVTTSPETCSRVARGLTNLPFYPQVLDAPRHQCSSYFLLREILRLFPNQPLSLGHVLQLLKNQRINAQAYQGQILNLLEGEIPAGLVPSKLHTTLLTPESKQNPDYQTLIDEPLFSPQSNQIYSLNPKQREHVWLYLAKILENTHQTLEKPLAVDLGIQVTT